MVYQSDNFPNMEELPQVPRRRLNDFEVSALKQLQEGEETVTSLVDGEIQMVGSLRAAHNCLKCHDASRGALLGALSYSIQPETTFQTRSRR